MPVPGGQPLSAPLISPAQATMMAGLDAVGSSHIFEDERGLRETMDGSPASKKVDHVLACSSSEAELPPDPSATEWADGAFRVAAAHRHDDAEALPFSFEDALARSDSTSLAKLQEGLDAATRHREEETTDRTTILADDNQKQQISN